MDSDSPINNIYFNFFCDLFWLFYREDKIKYGYEREKQRQLSEFDSRDGLKPTFGLRSGYMIPHTAVNEYLGDWDVPLAQPFTGLRLRYNHLINIH